MVWTNAVGAVFTAALLSAGDRGAVFVFPEDGATNTIALSQLSPESARRVCEETGYIPLPPSLVPSLNMSRTELRRLDALVADGRLDAGRAAARRRRVFELFSRSCREKGLSGEAAARLLREPAAQR